MNLKEQLMVQELYTKQAKDNGKTRRERSEASPDEGAAKAPARKRKTRGPNKPKV